VPFFVPDRRAGRYGGFDAFTPPLEEVLRRTGKAVEAFEQEFSAINCTEQVSQVEARARR